MTSTQLSAGKGEEMLCRSLHSEGACRIRGAGCASLVFGL